VDIPIAIDVCQGSTKTSKGVHRANHVSLGKLVVLWTMCAKHAKKANTTMKKHKLYASGAFLANIKTKPGNLPVRNARLENFRRKGNRCLVTIVRPGLLHFGTVRLPV